MNSLLAYMYNTDGIKWIFFFEKRLQKAQIKQASKRINAYFIGGKKDYILSISENMG